MSSPPSQRHRRRLAPVVIALVLTAAVAAALSAPGAARAGAIHDKRQEAANAEIALHNLYAREDAAVNAFDAARAKLANVKQRIRANTFRLKLATQNLHAAQSELASIVVSAYKGSQPDAAVYVLGAGSFTDLINRLDVINRSSHSEGEVLHTVTVAERQVAREQRLLKADRKRATRLVARTHAAKTQVEGLISSQQAQIDSLRQQIRSLVKQRNARIAAAKAAARAAAAAQAAQNPTPAPTSPVTTTTPPPTGPIPPASSLGAQAVQIAMGELGVPYVWGGASPQTGFDCSGLTMWVYAQLGIHLDHYTVSQWNQGVPVPANQLAPGDLVFFEPGIGHVGLYIGGGNFIEAPHTGGVVQISSLSDPWYQMEYQGARRVTGG